MAYYSKGYEDLAKAAGATDTASVKKLQEDLNRAGASLTVDGIWGKNTQSAYEKYGSALTGSTKQEEKADQRVTTGVSAAEKLKAYDTPYGEYKASEQKVDEDILNRLSEYDAPMAEYAPSAAVQDALAELQAKETAAPGEYESRYGERIEALLESVLNREDFAYDFNADPLYQMYSQQYQQKGQRAMMDTMGEAAALTGGYGNSYAQTAGQQAYQSYLGELNDRLPELMEMAYQRYSDEIKRDNNSLATLRDMDETDYGRYRDGVGDYRTELNYLYGKYSDMSEQEYERYLNDREAWEDERDYWLKRLQEDQDQANFRSEQEYQAYVDGRKAWEDERDYWFKRLENEQKEAREDAEYQLALEKASTGGGSKKSGSTKKDDGEEKEKNTRKKKETKPTVNEDVYAYTTDPAKLAEELAKGNYDWEYYAAMKEMLSQA